MLLAQLAPIQPSSDADAHVFYIVVGSLIALLSLASLAVVLFRRKPPIEADFPTKQEVAREINLVRAELHREIGGVKQQIQNLDIRNEQIAKDIFEKLDGIATSFNQSVIDIHRALGRLEGRS